MVPEDIMGDVVEEAFTITGAEFAGAVVEETVIDKITRKKFIIGVIIIIFVVIVVLLYFYFS